MRDISKIYLNNTKLANEIYSNNFNVGDITGVNVGVTTASYYAVNPIDKKEVEFSYYDRAVADAIYTICKNKFDNAKPPVFTLGQVLRVMSCDMSQTLTKCKKAALVKSIAKLASTVIAIVCVDEYKSRNVKSIGKIMRPFLPLPQEKAEKMLNNTGKFQLAMLMPLYEYAENIKQMISIPPELLACKPLKITNSSENILIKRFLIRRLEALRNDKNNMIQRRIVYFRIDSKRPNREAGMFPDIGINIENFGSTASWRHKLRAVHKTVKTILDWYVEIGYINGYDEILKNNVPYGVEIANGESGKTAVNNPWEIQWGK